MGSGGRWRAVASVAVVALLLGGCDAPRASDVPTVSGDVTAAVIAPFTGTQARLGTLLAAPCLAAADLINRAGGIMGRKLHCTDVDDSSGTGDAVADVTRAIATTPNLDMALGLESSSASLTLPLVETAKLPTVTTSALALFDANSWTYYWRLIPAADAEGAAFASWAVSRGYRHVDVAGGGDPETAGAMAGLQSALSRLGGSVGETLSLNPGAAPSASDASRIAADRPDALIWWAGPASAAIFVSEYRSVTGGEPPPLLAPSGSEAPALFSGLSASAGIAYATSAVYLLGPVASHTSPAFDTYSAALLADSRTAAVAAGAAVDSAAASEYDGVNIFALAMIVAKTTVGAYFDRDVAQIVTPKPGAVVVSDFADGARALAAGRTIQYAGVLGSVMFDPSHNVDGDFAVSAFAGDGSTAPVTTLPGAGVRGLL